MRAFSLLINLLSILMVSGILYYPRIFAGATSSPAQTAKWKESGMSFDHLEKFYLNEAMCTNSEGLVVLCMHAINTILLHRAVPLAVLPKAQLNGFTLTSRQEKKVWESGPYEIYQLQTAPLSALGSDYPTQKQLLEMWQIFMREEKMPNWRGKNYFKKLLEYVRHDVLHNDEDKEVI
ncbi:MAG: hypothetical protein WCG27_08615, partial [Pseudomonadota bacterium]